MRAGTTGGETRTGTTGGEMRTGLSEAAAEKDSDLAGAAAKGVAGLAEKAIGLAEKASR